MANHTIRTADGGTVTVANYTRGKAIKLMCTECMGWSANPRDCTDHKCPLYPFRGKSLASMHSDED